MKTIAGIHAPPSGHWVGDGFPVRSLFTYDALGQQINPFLLLDYAGPMDFTPTARRRGVGQHPHRGFETVSIVYNGEVEHRDSTGAGGIIGPGDVQWMTAASGILHEEFHSPKFARQGGPFEMFQLWVNLPARDKQAAPGYQTILSTEIPVLDLPNGAGRLRIIAGSHAGQTGPARTFTPMNVWDGELLTGKQVEFELPVGHLAVLVTRQGTLLVNDQEVLRSAHLAQFGTDGTRIHLEANNDASFLLLSAAPLDEHMVGYGPFVMNSTEEIRQAIDDFNAGRFGNMKETQHA